MGKLISEEESRLIVADAIQNNMTSKAISEKYGINESIACYIAKYGKLGYELADKKKRICKKRICPSCGTQLDKKMHFCWKCGTKAVTNKDEILEQTEKLLDILTCYPCNQTTEGIGIVNRIKDYIEGQNE